MDPNDQAVTAGEITAWVRRALDLQVTSDGGHVGELRSRDFRQVTEISRSKMLGTGVGYFEMYTSDGSAFEVTISEKG
jgi:hypothetical protein